MRTVKEFLIQLTRRGVTLQVSEGNIRYSAPEGALTPMLRADLARFKPEILSLYSGFQIPDALNRIADIWDEDIESKGEGDVAGAWIRASNYWQIIKAAENELDRIGKNGNPDELNAACSEWITSWVEAIAAWRETCRYMHSAKIVQPRAAQSKDR
jgi:hypothetical protein